MSALTPSSGRPVPDQVLVDIADYVAKYEITSDGHCVGRLLAVQKKKPRIARLLHLWAVDSQPSPSCFNARCTPGSASIALKKRSRLANPVRSILFAFAQRVTTNR